MLSVLTMGCNGNEKGDAHKPPVVLRENGVEYQFSVIYLGQWNGESQYYVLKHKVGDSISVLNTEKAVIIVEKK